MINGRYPQTAIISKKNFNGDVLQRLKIAISSAITRSLARPKCNNFTLRNQNAKRLKTKKLKKYA